MADSSRADTALTGSDDPDDLVVSREVWARSRRPFRGEMARFALASTLVLMGLVSGSVPSIALFILAGVASFFAIPIVVDRRLERMGAELGRLPADRIEPTLKKLEDRWLAYTFAPHGWVAAQQGRLHLRNGDGRAAATSFAEYGRMTGSGDAPEVLRGQAHGFVLSGDRKRAREMLKRIEDGPGLSDADRLDYAIVLLQESGRHKQARSNLEAAESSLADSPRWQAAMAQALARTGEGARGVELYEAAVALEAEVDAFTRDLIKRARKALRSDLDARERPRKSESPAEQIDDEDTGPEPKKKKKKGDRRRERRERRKKNREKRERKKKPGPQEKPAPARVAPAPPAARPHHGISPAATRPAPRIAPPPSPGRPTSRTPPAPTPGPRPAAKPRASAPTPASAKPTPATPLAPAAPRKLAPTPAPVGSRKPGPAPTSATKPLPTRPPVPAPARKPAPAPVPAGTRKPAPAPVPAAARKPAPAPAAARKPAPAVAPRVVPPPPAVAPPKVPPPPALGGSKAGATDAGWADLLDAPVTPKPEHEDD